MSCRLYGNTVIVHPLEIGMALHVEMAAPQEKSRVSYAMIPNNLWLYCIGDIKQDLGMTR